MIGELRDRNPVCINQPERVHGFMVSRLRVSGVQPRNGFFISGLANAELERILSDPEQMLAIAEMLIASQ